MGSKYDVIGTWLQRQNQETVRITITELEVAAGVTLPPYTHQYPWANDRTQPLPRAYMGAGYLVSQPEKDKEILQFRYDPERSSELLAGANAGVHRSRRKEARSDVPRPCIAEVEKYLCRWDNQENYLLQEQALDKLFFDIYPDNTDIKEILIKVSCLNDFYSTNIYNVFAVAKHIQTLDVDERLNAGDGSLVQQIAQVDLGNKTMNFYSFATKYCSHHQPTKYAIWDSYVDEVLRYFRDVDGFCDFGREDLKNYPVFESVLHRFAEFYDLESYTLKDLDRYLWQLGKDKFPQKRYQGEDK